MTRPRFLTLEEAGELARTPVKSIRLWISSGRLRGFKPGRRVLVREADLLALIEGTATSPLSAPIEAVATR